MKIQGIGHILWCLRPYRKSTDTQQSYTSNPVFGQIFFFVLPYSHLKGSVVWQVLGEREKLCLGSNQLVVLLHYDAADKELAQWTFAHSRACQDTDLSSEKKSMRRKRMSDLKADDRCEKGPLASGGIHVCSFSERKCCTGRIHGLGIEETWVQFSLMKFTAA